MKQFSLLIMSLQIMAHTKDSTSYNSTLTTYTRPSDTWSWQGHWSCVMGVWSNVVYALIVCIRYLLLWLTCHCGINGSSGHNGRCAC